MGLTFRAGVPYSLDVRKLCDAFPVPTLTEGREIPHHSLEEIINVPKGHQRYYAVVNSWIGQMRNSNGIFIIWKPTIGIRVLPPEGVLEHAETRTRQKIRLTRRAISTFAWVDGKRLDAMGQKRLDHQMRNVAILKEHLDAAQKATAIDLAPIKSLPKPKIIREA